mmetsp:Transcript_8576/g.31684  ORF Transcript_8576/g.31684 Transcript_8576/m.31684 type:complete len:202 (-) Transcript_8576:47-652(-)
MRQLVPRVRVRRELAVEHVLVLLHVEGDVRSVLRARALHRRAAGATVGPDHQRNVVVAARAARRRAGGGRRLELHEGLGGEVGVLLGEPVEEVVLAGDVDVARVHVEALLRLGHQQQLVGEDHRRLAHRLLARQRVRDRRRLADLVAVQLRQPRGDAQGGRREQQQQQRQRRGGSREGERHRFVRLGARRATRRASESVLA